MSTRTSHGPTILVAALSSAFATGLLGITEVLVHDPWLDPSAAVAAGVAPVSLTELAARARIVSIHAPVSDPARPMIDKNLLAVMRRDAVLINTARGAHVDENALAEALREGRLYGAGLDVFRTEPPAQSNPLLSLPNVVISDHAGWYSEATVATLQRKAGEAAVAILTGQAHANWVNP